MTLFNYTCKGCKDRVDVNETEEHLTECGGREINLADFHENTEERMTVQAAREKLWELWEDDERDDALTYDQIFQADFDELNEMLIGSGYIMEEII